MKINKQNALLIWESIFGSNLVALDFTGRYIYKDDFNNKTELRFDNTGRKYNFGWNIHHILPISLGGTNEIKNLLIVHWKTNAEAAGKNTFSINGILYQVRKIKYTHNYGIFQVETDERVDYWKDFD
ncbi:MAG: HNH endonuclease [Acholeplasmataceae bacterium]|nr:HNH endonuclease [Acholeplasmataceae bacterium]